MFFADLISSLTGRGTVINTKAYKTKHFHEVYDITVDVDHCYYIDGYLVSNSHANDALRYLAVSHKKLGRGMSAEELKDRYNRSLNGGVSKLPRFFQ